MKYSIIKWQLALSYKQLNAGRRAEVQTRVGTNLVCKNSDIVVKINISPQFTAFIAKSLKNTR